MVMSQIFRGVKISDLGALTPSTPNAPVGPQLSVAAREQLTMNRVPNGSQTSSQHCAISHHMLLPFPL